jgi:chitin disaccharide deacetylase
LRTLLIVNADDLGYDPEIDRGILEAHARGIVTAASAMVDTPFAERALGEAPASLDLGLHAVLPDGAGPPRIEEEIARQLAKFTRLRGTRPTHLDSHRHAHAAPGVEEAFAAVAARERLPLRAIDGPMRERLRAVGAATTTAFLGDARAFPYWTPERLLTAIAALPAGSVELMCHPGYAPSHARTRFGREREVELAALCEPAAREAVTRAGATLGTFAALAFPPG